MTETTTLQPSKGLAITYLVRLSIASPSGGRSEIENLNVIKKIREGFLDFPYASSQAMKRALRDTLKGLGYSVSPIISSSPARTAGNPIKYIDDDLFGYMDPSSKKEIKIDEDSEENEAQGSGEDVTLQITKDMIGKLKPKKAKEKIEEYFTDNPTKESIAFSELANIGLEKKEIESIKKAVTKDDAAILKKMLQNLQGVRKAVISMTPLISLSSFDDNVDFGANMMGLKGGVSPMPYETEVHRGWYRITLYIDLDRIGTGDGFINKLEKIGEEKSSITEIISQKDKEDKDIDIDFDFIHKSGEKFIAVKKEYSSLANEEKYKRAKALLDAIRFLAPSGRSSNWLIDLTPKLMVAAYVKGARTPFLEAPLLGEKQKDKNVINIQAIKDVKDTFADGIENNGSNKPCLVVGYRGDLLEEPNNPENALNVQTMKTAFDTIGGWLKTHFNIQDPAPNSQPQQGS